MGKRIIPQHEPLRVPQGWTEQARAFVIQLERIIDRIYAYVSGGLAKHDEELSKINNEVNGLGTIVFGTNNSIMTQVVNGYGVVTRISEITLPAGTWIVVATIEWVANANGSRQLMIDSRVPAFSIDRHKVVTTPAIQDSNVDTYQQAVYIHKDDEEKTLGIYARQSSGSTLGCYPYFYAIKICN